MTALHHPSTSHEPGSRASGSLRHVWLAVLFIPLSLGSFASAQSLGNEQSNAGPLDTPLPGAIVNKQSRAPARGPSRAPERAPAELRPGAPEAMGAASLKSAVREEQDALEQLSRPALNTRAQRNERAAQIALGVSYARESALLGFSVAAANSAASDAVRWYNKAASQGFPGAPSLDIAGVRHYPVRAARTPVD